jgi:hypothetical protein
MFSRCGLPRRLLACFQLATYNLEPMWEEDVEMEMEIGRNTVYCV